MLPSDSIYKLRQEFRGHLEEFYTHLNLAPPYHSIEKAVQHFSNTLRTKPEEFSQKLLQDASKKWTVFQEIFLASGLHRKHRGIIEQLALSQHSHFRDLADSPESGRFLQIFLTNSQESTSK
ncbi:MAG: hypothetical protein NPIRA03_11910 [Nitrospirales bacterium]|nr:MAG: hypothetical protein NPIRA03_11910 [Nitrospirales bacterium]